MILNIVCVVWICINKLVYKLYKYVENIYKVSQAYHMTPSCLEETLTAGEIKANKLKLRKYLSM